MGPAQGGSVTAAADRSSKIMSVIRVSSGNFLEMYDFFVFAYYATAIGKAYFPGSDSAALLNTLAVFGVGFLMRPIGGLVLGAYIDTIGRRRGLIVTLGIMSVGTLSIALIPGYETLGLLAPLLIIIGRLLQGFSAGVELGGVSVYLSEIATPGNKGFYVSWQSASQQVAVIFVAVLGVGLEHFVPIDQMNGWGWRIPFIIGCMIVPLIFLLRRSLQETDEFLARKARPTITQIFRSVAENWPIVLIGVMMVLMTTVSFYMITAYTPTFGRKELNLSSLDSLVVTGCVGLSNLFWLPLMGALSDRIGRRPLLILFSALAISTAYPALSWLVGAPTFLNLLVVELWLSFLYGSYNGAMVVYLTEIMPPQVRTSGFSLAYSLATAFGGFTPYISTWLIEHTGNKAIPGAWLSAAAGLSLIAALLAKPYRGAVAGELQVAE
jgi:MHS family citrate/tricarballylate:H+ symporter-like MFS transporter